MEEVSVPKLRDDYIIVQTKAVALNPTDWKHVAFVAPAGCRASYLAACKNARVLICTCRLVVTMLELLKKLAAR